MGKALKQSIAHSVSSVRFTVGRDEHGWWIVDDRDGLVGGIFRDRASAVHFAIFESDHQPGAVCCVPDGVIVSSLQATDRTRARAATDRSALHLV